MRNLSRLAAYVLVCLAAGLPRSNADESAKAAASAGGRDETVVFEVMSRQYERPDRNSPAQTYAFVLVGRSTDVEGPLTPKLSADDLKSVANEALQARGFRPAAKGDRVDLAIVVAYGTGAYPPPFKLFRASRDEPLHLWPKALQQAYHRYYAGGVDPESVEEAGSFPTGRPVDLGKSQLASELFRDDGVPVHYVAIKAFDWATIAAGKEPRLLWETRVTTPARGRALEGFAGGMLRAASSALGRDQHDATQHRARIREGVVTIGDPVVADPPPARSPVAPRD